MNTNEAKSDVGAAAHNAYEKGKDTLSNTYEKGKDTLNNAYEKGKDTAHNARDKVSTMAENASDKGRDTSHNAYEKISDTTHNVSDKGRDTSHSAYEKGRDTTHNTGEKVLDTTHNANDKGRDTSHNVYVNGRDTITTESMESRNDTRLHEQTKDAPGASDGSGQPNSIAGTLSSLLHSTFEAGKGALQSVTGRAPDARDDAQHAQRWGAEENAATGTSDRARVAETKTAHDVVGSAQPNLIHCTSDQRREAVVAQGSNLDSRYEDRWYGTKNNDFTAGTDAHANRFGGPERMDATQVNANEAAYNYRNAPVDDNNTSTGKTKPTGGVEEDASVSPAKIFETGKEVLHNLTSKVHDSMTMDRMRCGSDEDKL